LIVRQVGIEPTRSRIAPWSPRSRKERGHSTLHRRDRGIPRVGCRDTGSGYHMGTPGEGYRYVSTGVWRQLNGRCHSPCGSTSAIALAHSH
jgi:hypothetical protein